MGRNGAVAGKANWTQPGPVDQIAVVSGSCSPTTERQIRHATGDSFVGIEVDPIELVSEHSDEAISRAAAAAKASLETGLSVVVYTALGPTADRGAEIDRQNGAP